LNDTVLKFDGPLFDVPAGAVKMAVGAQYTELNNKVQNGAHRSPTFIGQTPGFGAPDIFVWDAGSDTTRYQKAGFVELFVPAIAPEQEVPMMRALNFSGAVRHDDYSDAGSTTNPKLGFTWELVRGFSLRGSWGTSFRAPNIPEMDNGVFSVAAPLAGSVITNNSGDPTLLPAGSNVVIRIGGNPELEPEEGETWSLGFDWSPEFLTGLRVATTYYRVEYESRIVAPPWAQFLASPRNRQSYAPFITQLSQVAACNRNDRSTWHPALRDVYENPPIDHLRRGFLYGIEAWNNPNIDICNVSLILDGRNINAASTLQDGIDLQLGYSFAALGSFWNAGLVGSRILTNEQTFIAGAFTEDILDRINFPVDLRARASLTWARAGWNASLFGNYVDGYRNDVPPNVGGVPQRPSDVPSWTTWDMSVGYSVPEGTSAFLDGIRAIVNVQNMFDREPPTVLIASGGGAVAMDARNHNPFGRIFQFSLTKRF
jgi:iron complex outermembrane recepter protein